MAAGAVVPRTFGARPCSVLSGTAVLELAPYRRDVRASDEDRERAARALRHHFAAGRLEAPELEPGVAGACAARTRGELAELLSDLPSDPLGQVARSGRPPRREPVLPPPANGAQLPRCHLPHNQRFAGRRVGADWPGSLLAWAGARADVRRPGLARRRFTLAARAPRGPAPGSGQLQLFWPSSSCAGRPSSSPTRDSACSRDCGGLRYVQPPRPLRALPIVSVAVTTTSSPSSTRSSLVCGGVVMRATSGRSDRGRCASAACARSRPPRSP